MKLRWKWQKCDDTFKPVWTGQAVVHRRLVILKMRINDFCGIKQENTSGLCSILESTNGSPQMNLKSVKTALVSFQINR